MNMTAIGELLNRKHLQMQVDEGKRISISELARRVKTSQQNMSAWMLGQSVPDGPNISLLADYFGDEIYDALGMRRPVSDSRLRWLLDNWEQMAEAVREEIFHLASGKENRVVYPVVKEKADGPKNKKHHK